MARRWSSAFMTTARELRLTCSPRCSSASSREARAGAGAGRASAFPSSRASSSCTAARWRSTPGRTRAPPWSAGFRLSPGLCVPRRSRMDRTFKRILPDEGATERLGNDIAAALRPGDAVLLHGDLGAGKASRARAVVRSLAGARALEVPSPTFTLVQNYALRFPVQHVDLYRLADPGEVEELALDEALEESVILVEWPERAPGTFAGAIEVRLSEKDDGREAEITAPEEAAARLERAFRIRAFLETAGQGDAWRVHLVGDASARTYETIHPSAGTPLVLMNAPERRDEPVIRHGLPYSRIAPLSCSVSAFVAVANALRRAGISAPEIYAQDLDQGLLLLAQ